MSLIRKLEGDAVEAFLAENLPVCRLPATISTGLAFLSDDMWAKLLSRREALQCARGATSSEGLYGSDPLDTLIPIYEAMFDFQRRWAEEPSELQCAIVEDLYDPEIREAKKNAKHAIGASKVVAYASILERYLWATCNAEKGSKDITLPFQLNSGSVQVRPKYDQLCRPYRDGVLYWFHSIQRAMKSFLTETTQSNSSDSLTRRLCATDKLIQVLKRSEEKTHFQAMVANIANCALGIRALAAVSSLIPIR